MMLILYDFRLIRPWKIKKPGRLFIANQASLSQVIDMENFNRYADFFS
jgi:hypothetical protein